MRSLGEILSDSVLVCRRTARCYSQSGYLDRKRMSDCPGEVFNQTPDAIEATVMLHRQGSSLVGRMASENHQSAVTLGQSRFVQDDDIISSQTENDSLRASLNHDAKSDRARPYPRGKRRTVGGATTPRMVAVGSAPNNP
jgi:hypothetical protein